MVVYNNYCFKTQWNVVYKINMLIVDLLTTRDKSNKEVTQHKTQKDGKKSSMSLILLNKKRRPNLGCEKWSLKMIILLSTFNGLQIFFSTSTCNSHFEETCSIMFHLKGVNKSCCIRYSYRSKIALSIAKLL
jgi:hypothetical protein